MNTKPEPRLYRALYNAEDLVYYKIQEKETDLLIGSAKRADKKVIDAIRYSRNIITQTIKEYPQFLTTLEPIYGINTTNDIIKKMQKASALVGVGPMAGVAGTISEYVANQIDQNDVIIENGGDVYIKSKTSRTIAIHAGKSILNEKIGISIDADLFPLSICTSSGTIGHSLSFGKADAAIIISKDAAFCDCLATKCGNMISTEKDLKPTIEYAKSFGQTLGAVFIIDDKISFWGQFKLVKI